MAESLRVCLDRLPPRETFRATRAVGPANAKRAIIEFKKMWINGSTLTVAFLDGSERDHEIARRQARWWTAHANLSFVFVDSPDADIRVTFDPQAGAWSEVGTDARNVRPGQPTMNIGFFEDGTAGHEFGHAIGLGHEHQNPRGGIEWNEEVVIRELKKPPNRWSEEVTRSNVLDRYSVNQIRGTKFDSDSIMIYFFPDSWVKNGKGTKANATLSDVDKMFIAGREGYPHRASAPPIMPVLIGAKKAVSAAIGKPGEEDLFRFTVRKSARYVVRTGGKTDVHLKLFGPNSKTRLIDEDDDSEVDLNARLVADLVPGEYIAQVRHSRKRRGKGRYTLRVDRD